MKTNSRSRERLNGTVYYLSILALVLWTASHYQNLNRVSVVVEIPSVYGTVSVPPNNANVMVGKL